MTVATIVAVATLVMALAGMLVRVSMVLAEMRVQSEVQKESITRLDKATERLEQIPLIVQRVGQLEDSVRRVVSDIRDLREKSTEQRVKLESLHDVADE